MPNDAKLGLATGLGLVLLIALLFFRKEGEAPAVAAPPRKTMPTPKAAPPKVEPRIEPKVEPKIETLPKVELPPIPSVEPKVESEPKVEPKKFDPKIDPPTTLPESLPDLPAPGFGPASRPTNLTQLTVFPNGIASLPEAIPSREVK